jgi:hypothetical protein
VRSGTKGSIGSDEDRWSANAASWHTGIQHAWNLGWKLALVSRGIADGP